MGCNKKKYILYIVPVYSKYKFPFKNFTMLKYAVSSKDCTPHSMCTLDANAPKSIWWNKD